MSRTLENVMASLFIRHAEGSAAGLKPTGVLALPVRVETAAWAVPFGDELRVLVNHPGAPTTQLRVLRTHRVEQLPSLPIVSAGAANCPEELTVTGANMDGQPLVLGVAADGTVAWQILVDGPTPTRWPVPGCGPQPMIVWQTGVDKLEVARCGNGRLTHRRSISVGGPPLDVAVGADAVWSAWPASDAIQCVEIGEHEVRTTSIAATFPGSIAIGTSHERACVAWTERTSSFFAWVSSEAKSPEPPLALDLADAVDGRLAIVSGPAPLIWAQRADLDRDVPRWLSALGLPGESPLLIEGLVFSVAWWGDYVAVVGAEEIIFLKRVT